MGQIYVCTQCGEEYGAPGICEMCQIDLVPAEEDEEEYGFHEEGLEDDEDEEEGLEDEEEFTGEDEDEEEEEEEDEA